MAFVWTSPKVWETGEPLVDDKANLYISGNLNLLYHNGWQGLNILGTGSDVTKAALGASAWEEIDATQLSFVADILPGVSYWMHTHVLLSGATTSSVPRLAWKVDDTNWLADWTTGATPGAWEVGQRAYVAAYQMQLNYGIGIPADLVPAGRHTFSLWHLNNTAAETYYLANTLFQGLLIPAWGLTIK